MGTVDIEASTAPLPVTTLSRRAAMAKRITATSTEKQKQRRHGMRSRPEYSVWVDIRRRCYSPHRAEYAIYGGRGITMSDEWRESFVTFINDMGSRPTSKHQIDRIDNDGPYSKDNCRWSTPSENSNNRRSSALLTLYGETMSISQWARKLGVFKMTLVKRKNRGWSDEDILTKPLKNVGRTWAGKHQ